MKTLPSVLIFFIFITTPKNTQSAESSEDDLNSEENFKQIDKLGENEVVNTKFVNFNQNTCIACENAIKKYEDLVETIDNYVQRYVSLFLITSNLKDHEIKDTNEMISVDLEISITGEDLDYLQSFSKCRKNSSFQKNFYKLDAILSKIARQNERNFAENLMKSSKFFFSSNNFFSIVSNPCFYQFLYFLISILITWIIYYLLHKNIYVFPVLINIMLLWESFNKYRKELKETDIEIYVESLKGIPEECNRTNLRWYHNLWHYFSGDPCLQYHKIMQKNPVEEVSLFNCIVNTYHYFLIQTPVKIYGACVRVTTEEILGLWPQLLRYFVGIPLVLYFGIVIVFFILIVCGKRLKISFFGAALEIGDSQSNVENKRPALNYCNSSLTTVKKIRKLKPWTKSRFPKRIEGNIGRQKKFFLRASRSESELISEDEINFIDYEKSITSEINKT